MPDSHPNINPRRHDAGQIAGGRIVTRDDGLLTDVDWDVLGGDQIEAAQIAAANNRAPVKPVVPPVVPPDDQPRLVGDLAASAIPRGYGIAHRIARNVWQRATTEGDVA